MFEHTSVVIDTGLGSTGYYAFEALHADTQDVLRQYSAEGWELVSAVSGSNASATKVMLFFKRPARD